MYLSSPHVHTNFCDGRSTAKEMVESALTHGFLSIGFSGHARQNFDKEYCMSDENEKKYIAKIKALKTEYAGKIRIWLGTERDAYSCARPSDFEYFIASTHYLPVRAGYVGVDGDFDALKCCFDEYYHQNGLLLAKDYYQIFSEYVLASKPNIIGHFNLIEKYNARIGFFDAENKTYQRTCCDAMDKMITACDLMEVNTGGMARGYVSFPYPSEKMLAYWRALGGKVILSSDCHDAKNIAFAYDMALEQIKKAGFRTAFCLGRQDELFEEVRL